MDHAPVELGKRVGAIPHGVGQRFTAQHTFQQRQANSARRASHGRLKTDDAKSLVNWNLDLEQGRHLTRQQQQTCPREASAAKHLPLPPALALAGPTLIRLERVESVSAQGIEGPLSRGGFDLSPLQRAVRVISPITVPWH